MEIAVSIGGLAPVAPDTASAHLANPSRRLNGAQDPAGTGLPPVHLTAVANSGDEHGAGGVVDGVDDPVVAGANAQQPVRALDFRGLGRPWSSRKTVDCPDEAAAGGPVGDLLE